MKKLAAFRAGRINNANGDRHFNISSLVASLVSTVDSVSSPFTASKELVASVSTESFEQLDHERFSAFTELFASMEDHLKELGFESYSSVPGITDSGELRRIKDNQILAATMSSLGAQDELKYRKAQRGMMTAKNNGNDPSVFVMSVANDGPYGTTTALSKGLENYNEKATRDFRVVSIAYNLSAARQDVFGETLYPTVVVNPTEGGVTQNLTYAAVLKDVFHEATGALFDTREVNMVEAYRDPTILEDSSTKLIPIVTTGGVDNSAMFVDAADVAPVSMELEVGGVADTAPLAMGKKFDLIGISNRHQLIAGGLLENSDTIDPALRLKAIYVKTAEALEADQRVIKFITERMPTAVGQPNLAGDSRFVNIAFNTEDLVINSAAGVVDGGTNPSITTITTNNWTLRLAVGVNGSISTSRGDTWMNATPVTVEKIIDQNGDSVDKASGAGAALIAAMGDLVVIGYDLEANFTNTNRRERGHLIQTRTLQFRYGIPMHSPITLPMSTMDLDNGPGEVVKTLTVATNIRNSNNAVTRLLNYLAQLRDVTGNGYDRPKFGAVEGALSVMIRPTYAYATLDLTTALDSIRAQDRAQDVSSVILDRIKSLLFPAYRDSNIEAAYQTITGNINERPKVIIACDKEIANYLMTVGDDRTLGSYLKYDIVSTNNEKMDGKIVVVLTRENPTEDDVLNFGQFYYVPTIVADLPISRNGQISREIAAVPFNQHVNNVPFAIEIDVTGLKEVMGESVYNSVLTP